MSAFLARVACLCVALGFANAAFAGGGASVSMVVGQDRMGGDYKGFALAQPDAQQCRQACADDTACRSYTYVKPGIKGPEAMCFLKSTVVPATADACCTSGAKSVANMAGAPRATTPPVMSTVPKRVGNSAQKIADELAAANKAKDAAYEANQQFLQEGYEAAADEAQQAHDAHQCEVAKGAAGASHATYLQAFEEWLAASKAVSKAYDAFMASTNMGAQCASGGCTDEFFLANFPSYQAVMDLVPAAQAAKAKVDALQKALDKANIAAKEACH